MTWKTSFGVSWLFSIAMGLALAIAPIHSEAQVACSSTANWVQGQYYSAGAIVKYSDGKTYRAKFANPGYNPTVSTYYWESYACSATSTAPTCSAANWIQNQYYAAGAIVKYSDGNLYQAKFANPGYNPTISTYYWAYYSCSGTVTAPAPTPTPAPAPAPVTNTCSASNWIQGQYYAAGAVVKYSDGGFYRAKFANPGYNPTISTYYWEPTSCSQTGSTAPAPSAPAPAPAPTTVAGSAIPLPFRVVATYHPLWTGMRITEVPTSYNQIYLFHAVPVRDGSGNAIFEYGYVVNSGDIATVRNRGQRVVLTFGGANYGMNFSNRTQSQNFVNSITGIISSLGGQIDGLDFNNFEANVGSSPAEMTWIAQQLKGRYGRNFSISCPPAPTSAADLALAKAMNDAGVLDYAGPQFYDWDGFYTPESHERYIDQWVANFNGDASKVVIGYGANYSGGSALWQVQQSWARLKAKYPNLRGGFGWSSETDRNAGWTFGNFLGNNK